MNTCITWYSNVCKKTTLFLLFLFSESAYKEKVMNSLLNKKILFMVTGGIAAYKSAIICRDLIKKGAQVQVVMSQAACQFITPLTMETLSGKAVPVNMFERTDFSVEHIALAEFADTLLVAPATADYLARCASGRANDLVSAVTLAFKGTVLAAPAMNTNMWTNPATKRNIDTLKKHHNWIFVPPGTGDLACGTKGEGRMAEPEQIVAHLEKLQKKDLEGKYIVICAGPTIEDIDPVRYISNRSSGKTGYCLAQAALQRGARVCLITGPTSLEYPPNAEIVPIRSAIELYNAVMGVQNPDCIIMCAAVADYRPISSSKDKIKKDSKDLKIELTPNPDILASLGKKYQDMKKPILIGFALETQNLLENAKTKLTQKRADFIVANLAQDALEKDSTSATILKKDGTQVYLKKVTKETLAHTLLDQLP